MLELIKKWGWLPLVVLLVVLIIVGATRKSEPVEVPQRGEWENAPIAVLCGTSSFEIDQVNNVVERWEDRGHLFLGVIEQDFCPSENTDGLIYIRGAGPRIGEKDGLAYSIMNEDTGEILSSSIEIFVHLEKVLEHEIGHALGYDHVSREGHVMNSKTSKVGSNDEGLYREGMTL